MKKLTDTIKAKVGYRVKKAVNVETGETGLLVYDGKEKLFVAQPRTKAEMKDELENNEGARVMEIFTTVKGNQFAYWIDEEIYDADYITLLRRAETTEVPDA